MSCCTATCKCSALWWNMTLMRMFSASACQINWVIPIYSWGVRWTCMVLGFLCVIFWPVLYMLWLANMLQLKFYRYSYWIHTSLVYALRLRAQDIFGLWIVILSCESRCIGFYSSIHCITSSYRRTLLCIVLMLSMYNKRIYPRALTLKTCWVTLVRLTVETVMWPDG